MNKKFFLLPGLVLVCMPVISQTRNFADTLARLDKLFHHWNTATPGGVLTIARGETVLYNKAGGMANLEHHIANTTSSIFEAGSVSKQFTATSVLMLVEEGKIDLDEDIRKYIPELPDYGTVIQVKHLLAHTSGLKDWGSIAAIGGWPRGTRAYTQDHAREIIFRQKTLNFVPGSQYSYSNSNYTLLATLVERVSKESLASFTQKRIFEPVGMHHTQWRDEFREIVPGRSIAYERWRKTYRHFMPFENTHGHAALLTTTGDLLKWLRFWANGKFGKQLSALRETQGILNSGDTIGYAEGAVRISSMNGVREVAHSGATAGYRAWLAYYPSRQLSVVYLSNDGSTIPTSSIGYKVAEVFFGEKETVVGPPVPEPAPYRADISSYEAYTGKYYSEEADAAFTVQVRDNALVLFRSPASTISLRPVAPDAFEAENGIEFRFLRDRKKKVNSFSASVGRAKNIVFNRIQPAF